MFCDGDVGTLLEEQKDPLYSLHRTDLPITISNSIYLFDLFLKGIYDKMRIFNNIFNNVIPIKEFLITLL